MDESRYVTLRQTWSLLSSDARVIQCTGDSPEPPTGTIRQRVQTERIRMRMCIRDVAAKIKVCENELESFERGEMVLPAEKMTSLLQLLKVQS